MSRIGIISDTHGHLHPRIRQVFREVDRIIHAGDIGAGVIFQLETMAPVTAVRGNYDNEPEIQPLLLPDPSAITIAGMKVLLTHRMFTMGWDQIRHTIAEKLAESDSPPQMVIFGHTHFPVLEQLSGIWFINPGYCGADPLEGPSTAAVAEISGQTIKASIIEL